MGLLSPDRILKKWKQRMRVNTTSLEVKLRAILDHEIKTHKIKVRKFFKHENADGT